MNRRILRLFSLVVLVAPVLASAQGVTVRIMPPPRAQFLQFQKFDVRVEATATSEELSGRPRSLDVVEQAVTHAKNVILFIGDGMGVASRTAGRILSKGYTGGKANGLMAMDSFPYNGLLMTSSLNSMVTD